jgi:hypothetical protein
MNNAFANDKIKMEDINYHCAVHWTAEFHAPFLIHAAFASPPTGRTCELIDICGIERPAIVNAIQRRAGVKQDINW